MIDILSRLQPRYEKANVILIDELDEAVLASGNKGLKEKLYSNKEEIKSKGLFKDVTIEQLVFEIISRSPDSVSNSEGWKLRAKDSEKQNPFSKKKHTKYVTKDITKIPKKK